MNVTDVKRILKACSNSAKCEAFLSKYGYGGEDRVQKLNNFLKSDPIDYSQFVSALIEIKNYEKVVLA